MKKITLLFLSILCVISCSIKDDKDLNPEIASKEDKLVVFEDWEDFKNTSFELNDSNSDDFISNWIIEKGHSSMYNEELNGEDESDPLEIDKLTPAFLAIFNKDLQFQVGNEVITYSKSIFYAQKDGSSSKEKIGKIEGYETPIDKEIANQKVNIWSNNGYAAVQNKEFTRYFHDKCNGKTESRTSRRFRYRQQLRAYVYHIGLVYSEVIWLEAKLYINKTTGSNSFKHDIGSRRNYTYNLYGNVIFPGGVTLPFNIRENRNCISGNNRIAKFNKLVLAQLNHPGRPRNDYIEVTATGTVTHEVNGNNVSEKWINTVNW